MVDPTCQSDVLEPGQLPAADLVPQNDVDSLNASNSQLAMGLTNGTRYACAVSAVDNVRNAGPLSQLVCGVPEPADDFFELYRAFGGLAGGGFCDCAVPGVPRRGGEAALAAAALAAAALSWRRRRRAPSTGARR